MPTVFSKNGFRFFFYSEEGNEPMHIHVQYGGALAKFWIEPEVLLSSSIGLKPQEIKKAKNLIIDNKSLIQEKWNEFDKRRKNI
jgi:hypothetical protein